MSDPHTSGTGADGVQNRPIAARGVPLSDLKTGHYKGQDGGLYGNGSNLPPAAHLEAAQRALAAIEPLDRDGKPSDDGKIGFISIGMSNTRMEFTTFIELANQDPDKSPQVVLVNGAQGSMGSPQWLNPERRREDTGLNTWEYLAREVEQAGLSPEQVQVAWMKQVKANPHQWGEFPNHAQQLADQLAQIAVLARAHYPNLKVMYLSSRVYAGWANKPLHPEPYAYETAFAVRWAIQEQIEGSERLNHDPRRGDVKAPLLLWGPYFWADGSNGRAVDGLAYVREDLAEDGTHPSASGRAKVATVLLDFFKNDLLAKGWFRKPPETRDRGPMLPFRMIGDIYYVGNGHVSSHLITSEAGHILIDAGMPGDGTAILNSVAALGLHARDIRYILITHSHIDHLGDARFLAEQTGAKIALHAADVGAAETPDRTMWGITDFVNHFEPFQVDVQLHDGDVITVGDKRVHVHHTPGHTPGCLTFSITVREDGQSYLAALFGGPGVNVFSPRGVERNAYGGTMDDFLRSLDRLAGMPVEVFLAPHPNLNDTLKKRDRMFRGEHPNPFIDPQGWESHIAERREAAARFR